MRAITLSSRVRGGSKSSTGFESKHPVLVGWGKTGCHPCVNPAMQPPANAPAGVHPSVYEWCS